MSLDFTSLESAIAQMKNILVIYNDEIYDDDLQLRKYLRTATIKYFEYTYAISLKMIKMYMEMSSADPDEVHDMTFNNLIREAFGADLVMSDVTVWREYRKQRGTTSHTYDEAKAQEVFEMIPDFLKESQYILASLREKSKYLD